MLPPHRWRQIPTAITLWSALNQWSILKTLYKLKPKSLENGFYFDCNIRNNQGNIFPTKSIISFNIISIHRTKRAKAFEIFFARSNLSTMPSTTTAATPTTVETTSTSTTTPESDQARTESYQTILESAVTTFQIRYEFHKIVFAAKLLAENICENTHILESPFRDVFKLDHFDSFYI